MDKILFGMLSQNDRIEYMLEDKYKEWHISSFAYRGFILLSVWSFGVIIIGAQLKLPSMIINGINVLKWGIYLWAACQVIDPISVAIISKKLDEKYQQRIRFKNELNKKTN